MSQIATSTLFIRTKWNKKTNCNSVLSNLLIPFSFLLKQIAMLPRPLAMLLFLFSSLLKELARWGKAFSRLLIELAILLIELATLLKGLAR